MENTFDDDDDHLHILLPQDVLIQILVLLPVISLLRFKSVCKSWRALIQTSFFIDLHLNTLPPPHNSKFGTFIFQTTYTGIYDFCEKKYEAFMLSSGDGGGGGDDYEFEKLKWEDLGFPPCYQVHEEFPGKRILMVGSCNGLICIHGVWRDVSLWNPATRQFRLLPKSLTLAAGSGSGSGSGDLEEDFAAFGYDVETKDYKVVLISWFKPRSWNDNNSWIPIEEYLFRVQVYNLSRDSWRLEEGINSFPGLPSQGLGENHGVYLNGSYYFRAGYAGSDMILSFDFTKEIFTIIQLPHRTRILTTYLGEKIAVFATVVVKDHEYDFNNYDIWVLNEHGGGCGTGTGTGFGFKEEESSWTKIHSIDLNILDTRGTPRGISNDGEFAFIATNRSSRINGETVLIRSLHLINLVTKEVVNKEFRFEHLVTRADVYKQSLVSICGN